MGNKKIYARINNYEINLQINANGEDVDEKHNGFAASQETGKESVCFKESAKFN